MPSAIAMPKLGMTMTEGTVIEWRAALGDAVRQGEVILIIESEKAEVEIEAAGDGYLRHVYVEPDETVPCATLLAALTDTADEAFDAEEFRGSGSARDASPAVAAPAGVVTAAAPAARADVRAERVAGAVHAPGAALVGGGRRAGTPAARKRARELAVDLEQVAGSGPGGRVTREDVEAFAAARAARVRVTEGVALEVASESGSGGPAGSAGPAIALLPGFGTDVSAFARQVPLLAQHATVYGVQPRGVAGSDAPEADAYDVPTAARDVAAVLAERAAGEPAHLIGASLGAATAIELALLAPEAVRSLVLITPFVDAGPRLRALLDAWCALGAEASPDTLARALLPWLFSPAWLADERACRRTVRGLADGARRVPAATLARAAAGLRAWSGTRASDLGRIGVPTLVIAAGGDLLCPDADTRAVADAIARARHVVVPEAGHAVALERPDETNAAILKHLEFGG